MAEGRRNVLSDAITVEAKPRRDEEDEINQIAHHPEHMHIHRHSTLVNHISSSDMSRRMICGGLAGMIAKVSN